MSSKPRIVGYIRPSIRHKAGEQRRALETAGADPIYEEGKNGETWAAVLRSLRKGDTVAVTSLARLGGTRATVREALADIERRGAKLLIVGHGLDIHIPSADAGLGCADELSDDRRRFTPAEAKRAADKSWRNRRVERTSKAEALEIWQDTKRYPTAAEALAHPKMAGWRPEAAAKVLKARYPERPGGRPRKPKA